MEQSISAIGNRSILELALPGTHNAASYEISGKMKFPRLDKYIYCQDESVWNQLVYGIRFLDLRLSYDNKPKNERDRIWIAHGPVRIDILLTDVLEQILAFILSTHQEIIILDFHRFEEGLEESLSDIDQRHAIIERLIFDYLGSFLIPVELGMNRPINKLIAMNKRIYVGYAREKRNRMFFHMNALHVWPGTDDTGLLFRHLNDRSCRLSSLPLTSYPISLMGALTPRIFGLIRDKYDGLRSLAEQINHDLSIQVFEQWWQCMNVLCTDYFLGNNIIELTIEANLHRHRHRRFFRR
ncbi:ectonucleotide pyrophosphatase/phosphodiesterase family member 5-like [Sarcoptes scabiei]|nr:ectonucleotide pyrophosphatase/phosphodiesterase family member 5-like [Sarcoptes scabiei]